MNTRTSKHPPSPIAVITHILCDRSGSMISFDNNHISLTKKLLQNTHEQSITSGIPNYITFTSFNHESSNIMENLNMLDDDIVLPTLSELQQKLSPHGSTCFVDTVLRSINNMELQKQQILLALPREVRQLNPDIVCVLNCTTDGADNRSINTEHDLKPILTKFRLDGGQTILLTANVDSSYISHKYGFDEKCSLDVHNNDPDAIKYAFNCVKILSREVSSGSQPTPFTPRQRNISIGLPTLYRCDSLSPPDSPDSPLPPLPANSGIPPPPSPLLRHNCIPII